MNYPLIGQRLFNVPLMIRPEKAEIVAAALLDHFGISKLTKLDGTSMGVIELRQSASDAMDESEPASETYRPYEVIDGVAIIPIQGSMAQRVSGLRPYSGMVGYNQIDALLGIASRDAMARAILLDIDTPGGEVARCFDTARAIAKYSARNGGKPIIGAANEQACSAGYALISACDEIYMPETAIVGSIGVWTLLVDMTRALDKDGLEVTMIRAGERKARGGPYEHADKATVTKLLDWVESTRVQFCNLVAANRKISFDQVMATEGDWYHGDDAIKQGLIDGIGPFEAIFDRARQLAK